jgi:5-formyltetrahydrofolate cyclo-ligase
MYRYDSTLMSWVHLQTYERKRELRAQLLALRNSHPPSELDSRSFRIKTRLIELPAMKYCRTLSTYLYIGSEVRTDGVVEWALRDGKRVIVPITDKVNKRLIFSELRDPEHELGKGNYGIREPKPEFRRPVALEEADVILVPGIAWDMQGYRIGYGAGYYDRSINSLKAHIMKLGLAYEFQLLCKLPRLGFDRRVNKILTEDRVINTFPLT